MINGETSMSSIIQTVRFADDQRRDTDAFYYTDGLLGRCTTARFQSLLYTEAFTSPLYNGEISVSFAYRGVYLTFVQRRDFSVLYTAGRLPRLGTTARFQCLLYTETFTSPLYNGEILVSFILYKEAFTSPLYNGDISAPFIYRGIHHFK